MFKHMRGVKRAQKYPNYWIVNVFQFHLGLKSLQNACTVRGYLTVKYTSLLKIHQR